MQKSNNTAWRNMISYILSHVALPHFRDYIVDYNPSNFLNLKHYIDWCFHSNVHTLENYVSSRLLLIAKLDIANQKTVTYRIIKCFFAFNRQIRQSIDEFLTLHVLIIPDLDKFMKILGCDNRALFIGKMQTLANGDDLDWSRISLIDFIARSVLTADEDNKPIDDKVQVPVINPTTINTTNQAKKIAYIISCIKYFPVSSTIGLYSAFGINIEPDILKFKKKGCKKRLARLIGNSITTWNANKFNNFHETFQELDKLLFNWQKLH